MTLALFGIGTAQPAYSIGQQEAAEMAASFRGLAREESRSLQALYRRTRIERRGSVLLEQPEGSCPRQTFMPPAVDEADSGPTTAMRMDRYAEEAPALALAAAREALARAETPASAITHLITVSCTGFVAPGFDIRLMKSLKLSPGTARTHVGFMGCHGAINALRVAEAFVAGQPDARVLLCATELCSLHYQYGQDPNTLVANAIFADGGRGRRLAVRRAAGRDDWQLVAGAGSQLFAGSEDAMTWRVGNHGFEMTLSARVPGLIAEHLGPWIDGWLNRAGLKIADVQSWAIHPGGPRILDQVAAALELSREDVLASSQVLAERGNMSSPTILFILDRLLREQAPRPCVAMAFGPGLVVEAALFA